MDEGVHVINAPQPLSRREVFGFTASLAAFPNLFSIAGMLAGCGGLANAVTITGQIDSSVVKGTNLIAATSAGGRASIAADGSFTVQVASGAHHMFLLDPAGTLAGLALSVGNESVAVNAESTVLALVMLTPGIATSDIDEFTPRRKAITSSAEFTSAVHSLKTQLASTSLPTAIASTEFLSAFEQLIESSAATVQAQDTIPDGITSGARDAKLMTIIMYALFPLLDMMGGISDGLMKLNELALCIFEQVKNDVYLKFDLDATRDEGGVRQVIADVILLITAIIVTESLLNALVAAGWLNEATAALLGYALPAILAIEAATGKYNMIVLAEKIAGIPAVSVITVTADGNGSVVVS